MNDFELRRELRELRNEHQPQRDLWPQISRQIGAEGGASAAMGRKPWLALAAAASIALAVSGGIFTLAMQRQVSAVDAVIHHIDIGLAETVADQGGIIVGCPAGDFQCRIDRNNTYLTFKSTVQIMFSVDDRRLQTPTTTHRRRKPSRQSFKSATGRDQSGDTGYCRQPPEHADTVLEDLVDFGWRCRR